jgi:CubicO group peptidase (beta-lactamase class C family)
MSTTLFPLPPQPAGLDWPTVAWPSGELPASSRDQALRAADAIFDLTPAQGCTFALIVVKSGRRVYERYAHGSTPFYLQYSWSMAKSITHALVGILVRDGKLDIHAPARVPEWQANGDPRREITVDQLLRMSSGLEFREDYVDGQVSDVIPMLMFDGRHDTGAYASAKPLARPRGTFWSYSSGTTNSICRLLRDIVGGPTDMLAFMRRELFEPIGMTTPVPKFDGAGTFVGSSYCLATPQDFARFGYLYLRDGTWDGRRILPPGWVDYARTPTYRSDIEAYGAHWWLSPSPSSSWFWASGYDGQRIFIAPDRDVVIVRCGRTPVTEVPYVWQQVEAIAGAL